MSTNVTIVNNAEAQSKFEKFEAIQILYAAAAPADADPVTRLQYEIAAACTETGRWALFPALPTRAELIDALDVLARAEAGNWPTDADGLQSIRGLPAMLAWYFTLDEQEAEFEARGGYGERII